MLEEIKKQFSSAQILITLLIIAVGLYIFQVLWSTLALFSDVFGMLIFAWVVSFLLEPIVGSLSKMFRLPKVISALIAYAIFFGLITAAITLLIPTVVVQIDEFGKVLPKYLSTSPAYVSHFTDTIFATLDNSFTLIPSVANFLFSVFITLLISFYFVIDKERINNEFVSLLPKSWRPQVEYVQGLIDMTFGSFLRIQLLFGIIGGVFTWLVLHFLGINFAASTALIAGIFTVIPMVGGILALIPPVAVAFLSDPLKGLVVFLLLLALQNILFNIVGPKMLGKALQLHPVIVLLSFFVGYKVAGGVGAIFAVPILGVIFILLHHLSRHFLASEK